MEKQSIIRILILLVLSAIVIYFIYSGKIRLNPLLTELELQEKPNIDSVVTSIIEKYGIPKKDIHHKKVNFENKSFTRDEVTVNILVTIPKDTNVVIKADTLILLIHYDLKNELSKYNFKVLGVENTIDRVTTLFIENDQRKIIKTIVFKILIRKERSYSHQLKNKKA